MGNIKDVRGEVFNRFTIIEILPSIKYGKHSYKRVKVKCECGNERDLCYKDLKRGKTKSCGCLAKEIRRDVLPGDMFGFWTVLGEGSQYVSKQGETGRKIKCSCICGKEKEVHIGSLFRGESKSCGCQGKVKEIMPEILPIDLDNVENLFNWKAISEETSWTRPKVGERKIKRILALECKCGNTQTKKELTDNFVMQPKECKVCSENKKVKFTAPHYNRLNNIFGNVRSRCNNPNCKDYKTYGAKGVKICEEWNTFRNFYDWAINNGYEETLTINRKDSNGKYSPDNCEWIERKENSRQTSNCKVNWKEVYEIRESNLSIGELAEKYNVSLDIIKNILNYNTWDDRS